MLRDVVSLEELDQIFSPFSPVTRPDRFYGRKHEKQLIERAIREEGRHVIIYGERGVGKTSLANIVLGKQERKDVWIYQITFSRENTPQKVWKEVLGQVRLDVETFALSKNGRYKKLIKAIDRAFLKASSISNNTLIEVFQQLQVDKKVLIVFDEFDVLETKAASSFAYTIKSFSDSLRGVTLFFIGIADTIGELITNHYSIERCLLQVRLQRMKTEELSDLMDNGLRHAGLMMEDRVKKEIMYFSKGLPYYVQLITKCAARSALRMRYNTVVQINLKEGIQEAIDQTYESAQFTYRKASGMGKNNGTYEAVVKACAMVEENERGMFRLADIEPLVEEQTGVPVKKKAGRFRYHMYQLCNPSRGKLLERVHEGNNTLYRFNNPVIKAYILLKLHQEGETFRSTLT